MTGISLFRNLARTFAAPGLAFFVAVLVGAPGANAGPEDSTGGGNPDSTAAGADTTGADPDSADAEEVPRTGRRFSPTYTSGYEINRNIGVWRQGFTAKTWVGPLDILSTTSVAITKDETLDRDRRNRNSNFTFNYKLGEGFRIASTLGLIRDQTVDAGRTSSSQNSERFNLTGTYERDLVPGLSGVFKVIGGTSRDHRDDPLTSSRESTGPHAEGSAELSMKALGDWSLTTSLRNARLTSTEDQTQQTTRDNNLTGNTSLSWKFITPGFDTWTFSAGRRLNRLQYPLIVQNAAAQETNTNQTRDLSLDTSTSPWPRLKLSGAVSYRNNDTDRDIDIERSQESIDRAADWRLNYQFRDSTAVEVHQQWSLARSLFEDPEKVALNGNIRVRALGGSGRRPLGARARVDVSGNYQIQGFEFDDRVNNVDDRDVLAGDFTSSVEYKPMAKVVSNLRFIFQHNQTIFIDSTRSGTNQTQQVFSITPTVEYKLTPRLTFREEGSVIANSTVINFDENQNRLSRTTELRSTIEPQLHSKLRVNLRHAVRFLQDGSYRRGADGIRRFGKSREDASRDLTLRVEYIPVTGLTVQFRANQRRTDIVTISVRGGHPVEFPTFNEFTEIEGGTLLSRTLSSGLQLAVDVRRFQSWTLSNVRNNYWLGSLSITQTF